MESLVIGFVLGLVAALWLSIAARVVRRVARPSDRAVRAEAERGLRELQQYLVHR